MIEWLEGLKRRQRFVLVFTMLGILVCVISYTVDYKARININVVGHPTEKTETALASGSHTRTLQEALSRFHVETVTYDGCEYILIVDDISRWQLIHKDNCKACRALQATAVEQENKGEKNGLLE